MEQLFHKKSTAILTTAAILLVVLLLCALLITLSQMTSMKARAETLQKLLNNAKQNNDEKQALLDFIKTDEYVVRWAEGQGLIRQDDVTYIESVKGEK